MPINKQPSSRNRNLMTSEQYLIENPGALVAIQEALDDLETGLVYRQYQLVILGRGMKLDTPQLRIKTGFNEWMSFEGSCLAEALVVYHAEAVAQQNTSTPPSPPSKGGRDSK